MGALHDELASTGRLKLDAGDYDIGDTPLDLRGSQYMECDGMDRVRIFYSGSGPGIRCNPDGVFTRGRLRGFTLWGNANSDGISYGQLGTGTKSAQTFTSEVRVTRCGGSGILCHSAQLCSWKDCWTDINGIGFEFGFSERSTNNLLSGVHMLLNTSHGMLAASVENTTMEACHFEDNLGAGLWFTTGRLDTSAISVSGAWFEGNAVGDIVARSDVRKVLLTLRGNQHSRRQVGYHYDRDSQDAFDEAGCYFRGGKKELVR